MKWHELRLDELLCLASSIPISALQHLGKPSPCLFDVRPPLVEQHHELVNYILKVWCPWFSCEFGVLEDMDAHILTARMLAVHTHEATVCWGLVIAVTVLLMTPNQPLGPGHRGVKLGYRLLFSTN